MHSIMHFKDFDLIYGPLYAINTFWKVFFWKNMEKYGKTAVFLGSYSWIGEIPRGRLPPD